jgi:hypothetical protein
MTADHILQACPAYTTLRRNHWLKDTAATDKLHGALEDLAADSSLHRGNVVSQSKRTKKNIYCFTGMYTGM